MEDFFKRIEAQYKHKLPFVIYRKPNTIKVNGLLQNDDELFFTKDYTEKGFVFSPFDDTKKTVLIPIETSEFISTDPLKFENHTGHVETQTQKESVSSTEKDFHISLVKKGVEAINNGQFKKVVLSRKETIQLDAHHPLSIFKSLISTYKSAFVYCWYHPKIGLWLGATPETLLKIEGNRFSIMALAGTQDYNGTLDVVWQNKEIQEQQYVTHFILNSLKPCVESVKVSETTTVKAGNLLHIKTMISAQLKSNSSLKSIISSLHPTPAVCGLPKLAAKQFILEHENYNREFYTGFLGELNFETQSAPRSGKRNIENRAYAITKTSTQLYVNLRCMQLEDQKAHIYVGGGITESSDSESEWAETVSKSLVIKSIL